MKRIFLILTFALLSLSVVKSQVYRDTSKPGVLSGVIHEKGTHKPVSGAKIAVKGANIEIYADVQGFFVIPRVDNKMVGDTWLQITAEEFETLDMPVTIGGIEELGVIFMTPQVRDLNPITVNDLRAAGSDVRNETFGEPGTAALLFGTNDVLVNAANYNLGMLGLKLRGYEWKNTDVYFNGVFMNEAETGYAAPLLWNGLNDAMGKAEGSYGLYSNQLYYGGLTGVSNMRIRPSEFRKRAKISYAFSNSLYNHRFMLSSTSGKLKNGWSLLVAASGRLGNGFAKGTKYESLSYLFVAEKDLDGEHSLMFTVLGAPTKRGLQNYSTQQAYDIADDNYYNSAWGDDNSKKRNYRTNTFHQPLISVSHNWDINDWTLLRTTAAFTFGKNSTTDLFWASGADDPRPDTYDKLSGGTFANQKQVDWSEIQRINTEVGTHYVLGAQHSDRWTASLNSIYDNEISETLVTTAGIQARMSRYGFYNRVDDLFGADSWIDNIKGTTNSPDLNHPNRIVKEGDHFMYDYNMWHADANIWNRWVMNWRQWDFMLSASASFTTFWRDGNMNNEVFQGGSEGKSDNQNFFNYSAKGSVSYPLYRGYIEGNGTYMTRAPQFRDAYLFPQVANAPVNGDLKSETIWGAELNYYMPSEFFDVRVSGFYTQFSDQTRTRFYYDNDYQSILSLSLTGLNQRHFGGEITASFKLLQGLTLKAAAMYGNYKYTSDPLGTLSRQNNGAEIQYDTLQMNGLYVGSTPQMVFTGGVLYDSPKKWWIGANLNYAGNNYAEVNPMRYAQSASSENTYFEQEKLKSAFTLDLYGGYTFEFGNKYVGININAHNLLANKSPIGAYEPLTYFNATEPAGKHASKYMYTFGRTVFLIVSFRF